MNPVGLFPAAAQWLAGAHLAKVVSVADPASLGRVQIQLLAADPEGDAPIWARVAVPFAGDNFGAFLIPGIGAEVLVMFTGNDASYPVVVGALWNGAAKPPESLPKDAVDRWTLCGRNGTRIAIVEDSAGDTVEISTPNGATAKLTDGSGGEIRFEIGGSSIKMTSSGIAIRTGSFDVQGSTVSIGASSVDVKTPQATFNMAVDVKTLTAVGITSANYSPGIGNVW